jgi:hypothetical protein
LSTAATIAVAATLATRAGAAVTFTVSVTVTAAVAVVVAMVVTTVLGCCGSFEDCCDGCTVNAAVTTVPTAEVSVMVSVAAGVL